MLLLWGVAMAVVGAAGVVGLSKGPTLAVAAVVAVMEAVGKAEAGAEAGTCTVGKMESGQTTDKAGTNSKYSSLTPSSVASVAAAAAAAVAQRAIPMAGRYRRQ